MKHRRKLLKEEISQIDEKNFVSLSEINGELVFEIEDEATSDLAEAVSILMRRIDENDPIWEQEISNYDTTNITPEKSLFWLTGGNKEWNTLINYNKPWNECYLDFQEEFGILIVNGIKKSKNLKELKEYFNRYLNLSILYDFALKRELV